MSTAGRECLTKRTRTVLLTQLFVGALVTVGFLLKGPWWSISALYGGLTSIALAMLLSRGVKRANRVVLSEPSKGMMILYMGAAQRFVLVTALFIVGLALLKLAAPAMLVGFGLTQLSFLVAARSE